MDSYRDIIYLSKYSRWLPTKERRETWNETVDRYKDYFSHTIDTLSIYTIDDNDDSDTKDNLSKLKSDFSKAIDDIRNYNVMPSMRALWTAGTPLELESAGGYNCAATTITCLKDFSEIMYLLMNGAGVGFSVEHKFISQLPKVPSQLQLGFIPIVIEDSRLGWAMGLLEFLECIFNEGVLRPIDTHLVRPKGSPLNTFGGTASGPEPLEELFDFIANKVSNRMGRQLRSIDVFDITTMIAQCVISGGTRRSATIALFDKADRDMLMAKQGNFWETNPNRMYANISAVVYSELEASQVLRYTHDNGTGEPGIVNRTYLREKAGELGRDPDYDYLVNPCGEIILRSKQFCNLSEVVVRPEDTYTTLESKVKSSVLLAMLQSTQVNFNTNILDPKWIQNSLEDRVLGVSLTGLRDNPTLGHKCMEGALSLVYLRDIAHTYARWVANTLSLSVPKAITTIKPSGTVSQLVDSSAGMHTRYAPYYIRRLRFSDHDPLVEVLKYRGVPWNPEVGMENDVNPSVLVFDFYRKAPDGSVCHRDVSAFEQLEYWRHLANTWVDHNPSATINLTDSEWPLVMEWIKVNPCTLTLLPINGGKYKLAPYEEITRETYVANVDKGLDLEFNLFETKDNTSGSHEYACVAGSCEV